MSKIFKLFINENIKTWKKFATKLLVIVILLALIGALSLTKLIQYMNEKSYEEVVDSVDWKESVKEEIKYCKEQLANEQLDEETRKTLENEIEVRELNLQYDISPYGMYWKSNILNGLTVSSDKTEKEKLINLIKNDDFSGYIEIQKQDKKQELDHKQITQEEYDDEMIILDLYAKCEIGKEKNEGYSGSWEDYLITNIRDFQKSIRTGIDQRTNKVLSAEKKQEYKDTIQMYIYRIENDIPPIEYADGNYRIIFETLAPGFVIAMIAVSAIIIAGGEISTEVSTGTIKFWALTPNKRWKIFTAKLFSVLFYIVVITLIMSLLTIAFANIFFDTKGIEYIFVKDGNIEKIENTLFIIGYYFAKTIPVIIFALLALMLSTITRNTAVAVSFSVATYMGNGIVMAIVNQYIKKDWIRFVPFNNLNIADKIFPNFQNPMSIFGESFATSTSLWFSLAVLGVCAILMLVTMYDSFNKRDII